MSKEKAVEKEEKSEFPIFKGKNRKYIGFATAEEGAAILAVSVDPSVSLSGLFHDVTVRFAVICPTKEAAEELEMKVFTKRLLQMFEIGEKPVYGYVLDKVIIPVYNHQQKVEKFVGSTHAEVFATDLAAWCNGHATAAGFTPKFLSALSGEIIQLFFPAKKEPEFIFEVPKSLPAVKVSKPVTKCEESCCGDAEDFEDFLEDENDEELP